MIFKPLFDTVIGFVAEKLIGGIPPPDQVKDKNSWKIKISDILNDWLFFAFMLIAYLIVVGLVCLVLWGIYTLCVRLDSAIERFLISL